MLEKWIASEYMPKIHLQSEIISKTRGSHIKPNAISNVDEKGSFLGQAAKAKVVGQRGKKNPHIKHGGREMVTLVETVTASGLYTRLFLSHEGRRK